MTGTITKKKKKSRVLNQSFEIRSSRNTQRFLRLWINLLFTKVQWFSHDQTSLSSSQKTGYALCTRKYRLGVWT